MVFEFFLMTAEGAEQKVLIKKYRARGCNSRNCSQAAMKFSCCQADEFVRVGLPGRQERCQNAVALFGHLPAIGAGNFGNQAMSVQQCQSPRDLGGLGALLLCVVGLPKQQGPDVTVAKALQRPFAPVDGGQQLGIGGRKGVECSVPTLVPPHRSANFDRLFGQGSGDARCCQSRQISVVGRSRNLGAPVKVSHPAAQRIPSHRGVGAGFRGAKDLEVLGVMDGRLRSQHIEAVVKFDRIAIDPVLEAHPFGASAPVGHHLAAKLPVQLLAEKTHNLLAAQIEHPMQHQAWDQPVQNPLIMEQHVAGEFSLGGGPVVGESVQGASDFVVQRVIALSQLLAQTYPVGAQLSIGQVLGLVEIFHPGKPVIGLAVAQPFLIHLTGQPVMAVEADVNEKGEPSLQTQVQQSKAWVLDIEVQVQALAQFQVRLELLGLVIASHFVGPARFHTSKDRYQALFNAIALSDLARQVFLGQGAAVQIGEGALEGLGQSLGTLADLAGQSRGKLLEVFAQHLGLAQILLKNLGAIQVAERTLKAQAVEGVKHAHDIFVVFLYKKVRDAVCWNRAFLFHETLLLHQPRPVSSSRSRWTPIHPLAGSPPHGLPTRLRLCRSVLRLCGEV